MAAAAKPGRAAEAAAMKMQQAKFEELVQNTAGSAAQSVSPQS